MARPDGVRTIGVVVARAAGGALKNRAAPRERNTAAPTPSGGAPRRWLASPPVAETRVPHRRSPPESGDRQRPRRTKVQGSDPHALTRLHFLSGACLRRLP